LDPVSRLTGQTGEPANKDRNTKHKTLNTIHLIMNKTFKLTIEYDGTHFCGWQRQKEDRTVQETIEAAIETISGNPVSVAGSGRTDSGVHALGQTASFSCNTRLDAETLQRGINSLLPDDVVILDCREMDAGFHARYNARSKLYRYRILNRRIPEALGRYYAWHIKRPLSLDKLSAASSCVIGTRDFKAFEGSGSPRSHTIRTITRAEWKREEGGYLIFEIEADGFLRFMVRNIVGTLVEVGSGKRAPGDVEKIIASGDRSQGGPTAPAHGLFLVNVRYS